METHFKNTNEWIQKTNENKENERTYYAKLKNNEDISMFNVRKNRTSKTVVPIHNVEKYDDTLYNFILETTQTIEKLNERIAELEKKC